MIRRPRRERRPLRGIPLRTVAPNAITVLALCFGLTGARFAFSGEWDKAVAAIVLAGILDGLDGTVARLLRGESRFGAELDSLSDMIAFGVVPAIIIYLWSLMYLPQFGWIAALAHAVCCALRLARFNARIDAEEQPRRDAGFLTGVPAPAGAAMALLPLILWLAAGQADLPAAQVALRHSYVVAPWTILVAFLMASELATYSWMSIRLRRWLRLWALVGVGLIGAALISAPWATLSAAVIVYGVAIPFASRGYAKVRRPPASPAR